MWITGHDVKLHVAVDGPEDAPPLLLLHGVIMSHRTWDWFLPDLVHDWRVHRLDFRGHGRSDRAPGTYLPMSFLSDATAVVEHIGQPMTIIGHSLGGMVAASLAQRRPDLVAALVMEDPGLITADPHDEGNPLASSSLLRLFTILRRAIPVLQATGTSAATLAEQLAKAETSDGRPNTEVFHDDAIHAWAQSQLLLDVEVLDPIIDPPAFGTVEHSFDPAAAITAPGLLLAADDAQADAIVFERHIQAMRAASPSVACRPIPGAGHLIHDELEHRDTFRTEVLTFLRSLD